VRGQEREHTALRDQVPGQHPRVQQLTVCPFEALHGTIIPYIRTLCSKTVILEIFFSRLLEPVP
jgi:hypothetical protein